MRQALPGRLEVENPGGLYGRITIKELGKVNVDPLNPFLAGAMEVLGLTENRFSGIPVIQRAIEEASLPPTEFESKRGIFRVTLRNAVRQNGEAKDLLASAQAQEAARRDQDILA